MQMIYCKENNEIQIISYYWEKYKYLEWTEHETLITCLQSFYHFDHSFLPESTEKWSGKCCYLNFSREEIKNLEN